MAEKNANKEAESVRLGFLSNFTIEPLSSIMEKTCEDVGIFAEVYMAPYGQYAQEIIDNSSKLYGFSPNLIFLLLDGEKLFGDVYSNPYTQKVQTRRKIFADRLNELKELLNILESKTSAKIVINEILLPIYSSFGILENKQKDGARELVNKFNYELRKFFLASNRLFVFDLNSFCMKIGYQQLVDKRVDYLADMKISIPALKELSKEYLEYVIPVASKTKKCIVLDLDNTLWGGIVGEVGIDGIRLGPEREGKPFLDFQKKLAELFNRGIILAINSKNNTEDAMNVIKNHRHMVLKENNFACMKINWQDKVSNMREIAEELNIGLDSMVFIDDDQSNGELIKEFLPEVTVIDLPRDPVDYVTCLEGLKFFSKLVSTKEDFERGKMYIDQRKREQLKLANTDLDSFLAKLKIQLEIGDASKTDVSRISQLTQKTNQFNLTTKRYQEEDIEKFVSSKDFKVKFLRVKDNFGDYGMTGVVIVKKLKDSDEWEIDSFLLSCRILGKKIEYTLMQKILENAKEEKIRKINATFIPTPKNPPAKDFLEAAGFNLIREDNSTKYYCRDV